MRKRIDTTGIPRSERYAWERDLDPYTCLDCGTNILDIGECYMLRPELWNACGAAPFLFHLPQQTKYLAVCASSPNCLYCA